MVENEEVKVISSKHWVIDKRIPVATIIGFLMVISTQAYIACTWATKMDGRVQTLEEAERSNKTSREKVATLEVKVDGLRDTLVDIKNTDLQDIKRALDHLTYPNERRK